MNLNVFKAYQSVVFKPQNKTITEEDMIRAMTINEELMDIGYFLSPDDVLSLASSDMNSFFDFVCELKDDVSTIWKKYRPMYPNFPKQVMEKSEAELRFHQILHYLSVIPEFYETCIPYGWLLDEKETKKTKKQNVILDKKRVTLISQEELIKKIKNTLNKKERLTEHEREVVLDNYKSLAIKNIPFKENISVLFSQIIQKFGNDEALRFLNNNAKNPNDVLDTLELFYNETKGENHLKTSEKRIFVKALSNFSENQLEENFASNQERNKFLLNVISITKLTKNPILCSVSYKLRNNELQSWKGKVEEKIKNRDEDTLEFIGKRPGEMLRMAGRLHRLGYKDEDITNELKKGEFKFQTLIQNATYFGQNMEDVNKIMNKNSFNCIGRVIDKTSGSINRDKEEFKFLYDLNVDLLKEKTKGLTPSLEGKKVFLDEQNFDIKHSGVNTNEKSLISEYIPSSIAYKIPKEAKYVRFFVFWNEPKTRVDVDLHAYGLDNKGNHVHIGYHTALKNETIFHSGDITTSTNSAEYIDVKVNDKNAPKYISSSINLYAGADKFREIQNVFGGAMVVDKINKNIELYEPKNCFQFLDLKKLDKRSVSGVDLYPQDGYMKLASRNIHGEIDKAKVLDSKFGLETWLNILSESNNFSFVNNIEDADVVMSITPSELSDKKYNYVLIDNNFGLNEMEREIEIEKEEISL